jgi:hypothetical protein
MAQLLGSGGMHFDIGHRMARVELGFNVSGMHANSFLMEGKRGLVR